MSALREHSENRSRLMMTLVALILAIACSNVANLLLARASVHTGVKLHCGRRERAVLGSSGNCSPKAFFSPPREHCGMLYAIWGIRFLSSLIEEEKNRIVLDAQLNWHVLALTAGLALITDV